MSNVSVVMSGTMKGTEELKTSLEWQSLCTVLVMDPDGWDRANFEYSWYEEKITRSEWERRMASSTVRCLPMVDKDGKTVNIWRDLISQDVTSK